MVASEVEKLPEMEHGEGGEPRLQERSHGFTIVLIYQRKEDASLVEVNSESIVWDEGLEFGGKLHEIEEEREVVGGQIDVDHFVQDHFVKCQRSTCGRWDSAAAGDRCSSTPS